MKRIAIVGSRPPRESAPDSHHALFRAIRADVDAYVNSLPIDTVVVSGDASGVDSAATEAAMLRGMLVVRCPVSVMAWRVRGRGIALVRNGLIVDICDGLIAFQLDRSNGTADAIAKARKAGKLEDVHEYWTDGRQAVSQ
jgi:hypothetical protein